MVFLGSLKFSNFLFGRVIKVFLVNERKRDVDNKQRTTELLNSLKGVNLNEKVIQFFMKNPRNFKKKYFTIK